MWEISKPWRLFCLAPWAVCVFVSKGGRQILHGNKPFQFGMVLKRQVWVFVFKCYFDQPMVLLSAIVRSKEWEQSKKKEAIPLIVNTKRGKHFECFPVLENLLKEAPFLIWQYFSALSSSALCSAQSYLCFTKVKSHYFKMIHFQVSSFRIATWIGLWQCQLQGGIGQKT